MNRRSNSLNSATGNLNFSIEVVSLNLELSRSSTEFPNQNLRQIYSEVPELWSDISKQTNTNRVKSYDNTDHYLPFNGYWKYLVKALLKEGSLKFTRLAPSLEVCWLKLKSYLIVYQFQVWIIYCVLVQFDKTIRDCGEGGSAN